jgi:hypothetical protein
MLFKHRITGNDVTFALKLAAEKFPQRRPLVLHDGIAQQVAGVDHIDCRDIAMDRFCDLDFAGVVFIYACSNHFNGGEFVEALIEHGGSFIPVWSFGPALYVDHNRTAHRVLEAEWELQNREGFAKWDSGPGDFINLCQAIEATRNVEGVFLEIGCYRGSSGSLALRYMREAEVYRDAWFFDVFDGFVYDSAINSADAVWSGTHATEGIAVVEQRLARHALPKLGLNVSVRRHNIVEEEIPREIDKIAVANIDVDLYEAVLAALIKVAPRMASGGIIIVEDPGHTPALVGARVALDQFLSSEAAGAFTPIHMESGQTFLINNGSALAMRRAS